MRAHTYPMYTHLYIYIYIITFIKEGMIFSFRNFFQKLSEFRQLPKHVYIKIKIFVCFVFIFLSTIRKIYIVLYKDLIKKVQLMRAYTCLCKQYIPIFI